MKNPKHEISNPKQIRNRAGKFETMLGGDEKRHDWISS